MSIIISTTEPKKFLKHFDDLIHYNKIKSWEGNKNDGYTHTDNQYTACFEAKAIEYKNDKENNYVLFNIIEAEELIDYAKYHGYLISSILAHTELEFEFIQIITNDLQI